MSVNNVTFKGKDFKKMWRKGKNTSELKIIS